MTGERKRRGAVAVGEWSAINKWANENFRRWPEELDADADAVLERLGWPRVLPPQTRWSYELIGRGCVVALVIGYEPEQVVGLMVTHEVITRAETGEDGALRWHWTETTHGRDYAGAGFTGQALRGEAARLLGHNTRPDQLTTEYVDTSEPAIRERVAAAERTLIPHPAGWSKTAAREWMREREKLMVAHNAKYEAELAKLAAEAGA